MCIFYCDIWGYFELRANADAFGVRPRLDGKHESARNNPKAKATLSLRTSGKIKIGRAGTVCESAASDNNWLIGLHGDCEQISRVKITKNGMIWGRFWKHKIWWYCVSQTRVSRRTHLLPLMTLLPKCNIAHLQSDSCLRGILGSGTLRCGLQRNTCSQF